MKKNIFEVVEDTLKTNDKYVSENGKLLKAIVYSDVMMMDKTLLSLLVSNHKIKETFFENIDGIFVFDKQKFAWFIESKEFLPDSYTIYTNKIGNEIELFKESYILVLMRAIILVSLITKFRLCSEELLKI